MLQTEPQFVMYFNFKKMRDTEFWNKFISDSLISSEKTFGNFLNVIKQATGSSISNGIDELYFSNSWIGDNAMVIKGTFDRKRVDDYVKTDSVYERLSYPNNTIVFKKTDINFYFYFKDDFTVCASNYIKQIENTLNVTDTSKTGLLANDEAVKVIEKIKHKENLWMMSNQKMFIRGIFENFTEMKKPKRPILDSVRVDSLNIADTNSEKKGMDLASFYKQIIAVSFSLKMSDKLELIMQNECIDEKSAEELRNKMEGIITIAKLASQFTNKKQPAVIKLLDKVEINTYNKTTALDIKLDENEITEIRKQKIF